MELSKSGLQVICFHANSWLFFFQLVTSHINSRQLREGGEIQSQQCSSKKKYIYKLPIMPEIDLNVQTFLETSMPISSNT